MIPSSKAAFQVITFLVGLASIITCVLTAYLLGFHLYLCKYRKIICFYSKNSNKFIC